ncbi:Os12g0538550 [Oryza sativa Japonica Group]|uniref:Os12g0538550 protein n=1 Tax=Oryza sativa subsp. japonica TaxID=39947 RepID=A0A0P0YAW2_ORYSJ|nr:hypothetical protein EE612_059985 [Oryza sativa]BAT17476.1 Os12g0538550 [Oryza sativa Japonica Group]
MGDDFDGEQKGLIKRLVNFCMIDDGKSTRICAIVYKLFTA